MNTPNSENEIAVARTTVGPENPQDSRSLWDKFVDGVRQAVGFKPVFLSEKWAEAKIRQENAKAMRDEAEAVARVLEARSNYEAKMAKIRLIERKGRNPNEALDPAIEKQLNASNQSPDEMLENVKDCLLYTSPSPRDS